MSRVLNHERCPRCAKLGKDRSADNLAVFEDGHSFCFACGYVLRSLPNNAYLHARLNHPANNLKPEATEYSDLTYTLPEQPQAWLNKYSITRQEQINHRITWSPSKELLVIPITDLSGNITGTNSRYFGSKTDHPKYINLHTNKDSYKYVHNPNSQILVIVEDILSAIIVGRQYRGFALCGTNLSNGILNHIISHTIPNNLTVVVWLDPDMHQKSIQHARRIGQYIRKVTSISDNEKDPKEYTETEICDIISRATKVFHDEQGSLDQVS